MPVYIETGVFMTPSCIVSSFICYTHFSVTYERNVENVTTTKKRPTIDMQLHVSVILMRH